MTSPNEGIREVWGRTWLERLWQDLRYGARTLGRSPGFAAVTILTLALGIGANTAMFSVINAVLLRPLDYHDPGRLYEILGLDRNGREESLAAADWVVFRERTQVFEAMALSRLRSFTLTGVEEPENLWGQTVSEECLRLLGVPALHGRVLGPEDFRPAAPPAVVIAHRLWQRRFGNDPALIGRALTLSGQPYTVVGIMPPRFQFPGSFHEVWAPWRLTPEELANHDTRGMAVARLKPGVSIGQARAELDTLSKTLAIQFPVTGAGWRMTLWRLGERSVREYGNTLWMLLGAVGFVLLIACLNVATLLLARAATREREFSIRLALGAGRWRLTRQLLTETLLLAGLGAGLGLLLGRWGIQALIQLIPGRIPVPRLGQAVALDGRVLGFVLAVTLLSVLLAGLAPAWKAAGGRRLTPPRLLAAGQIGLALVLVIGASLMIRSFARLLEVDPGFRPQKVLTVGIPIPSRSFTHNAAYAGRYQRILERVEALPGVEAAGLATVLPLGSLTARITYLVEGQPPPDRGQPMQLAEFRAVSPGYFRAMGIPLVRGRFFAASDGAGAPRVVIINQEMMRRHFPGQDPVGRRLSSAGPEGPWLTITGVVGDVKHWNLASGPDREIYLPYLQYLGTPQASTLALRTASDPLALAAAVRQEIRRLEPDLPVTSVTPMERLVDNAVAQPRFYTVLLASFAGLALLLAGAGIYGLMSYAVSRRTREIGIRLALGARPVDVLRLVLGQAGRLAAIGILLGLGGALAATRLLAGLLYGIRPTDPATFAVVSLILVAVALGAAGLPARRASRVDPAVALRAD